MEIQLLRDKTLSPTELVLEDVLGDIYLVYKELVFRATELDLLVQWNYYQDGKAWLCKVTYKKKTVLWLSVWDSYLKIGFFFTEKNCAGVCELVIDPQIIADFEATKTVGKLLPLIVIINNRDRVGDVLKIIEYKKKLK